ncbi:MAG: ComEC/Rec2 family competence protein [bacterium]
MVIILGTLVFILSACGLPRTRWVLFLGPLLILYTAMTGMQPSAVRACIMGIIFWMGPLLGRKPDIFTTLAASAIVILAISPGDLINIGFMLSYIAVLGLVLFCPVFSGLLRSCFAHDPLKLEPDPRWQEWLRSLWHGFSELLSVSLAAWLVTMPLTILFFGNFSPIGLPANLLVVPLSSLSHHHRRTVAHARILYAVLCRPIQSCQSGLDRPDDRIRQMVCRHPAWIHESPARASLGRSGVLRSFNHHPLRHLGLYQGKTNPTY